MSKTETRAAIRPPVIVGTFLTMSGVLCNQWLIGGILSPDGVISSLSHRAIVWSAQLVTISGGLALIRFRPGWPLVWKLVALGRLPLLILWTILVVETGVRAFDSFYALEKPERLKDTYSNKWLEGGDWFNGETRLYIYEPDSHGTTYGHPFRSNHWGFRGPEFLSREQQRNSSYRIMVLGDSTTMGEGVAEEERYSDVLAGQLRRAHPAGEIEVINLGVQGFETVQEAKILHRFWPVVQPDLVILGFSPNDPNLSYAHYLPHQIPVPPTVGLLLRRLLAFRLLEAIYDPAYRILRHEPTHMDEVWAAYSPRSRDWQLFQQSVADIGIFVRERTGRAPIVICLDDVAHLKRAGFYRAVVDTFEASGFVWVEIPSGVHRPISRFEGHANKGTHEHFARALFDRIQQFQVTEARAAALP